MKASQIEMIAIFVIVAFIAYKFLFASKTAVAASSGNTTSDSTYLDDASSLFNDIGDDYGD